MHIEMENQGKVSCSVSLKHNVAKKEKNATPTAGSLYHNGRNKWGN